jgi:hypothetical protein
MILLYLVIILITGFIPSIQFASFRPIGLIRNITTQGGKRSLSRRILVILQFSFSVFFILGTVFIHKQFQFMKISSLNNHKEEILYLPFKGEMGSKYEVFKNNLLVHPEIKHISAKNSIPTQVANKTSEFDWPGKIRSHDFIIEATAIDPDYFRTLGIRVISGKSFTESSHYDDIVPVILNETALKNIGITDPVGTRISLWGYPGEIIGIASDVHLKSLRNEIEGQVFYPIMDYSVQELADFGVILIQIQDDIPEAIALVKKEWNAINPGTPFEYHFLDEAVDSMYWEEMRLSRLMNYASLLSIVICCLGLLGLSIYSSNARIKEIGIRKINGASIYSIILMFNKDYIPWVLISFLIAFPLAWMIIDKWLQNFTYQIDLNGWVFLIAGLIILMITFLTINGQIIKVARKNPVDILRYE